MLKRWLTEDEEFDVRNRIYNGLLVNLFFVVFFTVGSVLMDLGHGDRRFTVTIIFGTIMWVPTIIRIVYEMRALKQLKEKHYVVKEFEITGQTKKHTGKGGWRYYTVFHEVGHLRTEEEWCGNFSKLDGSKFVYGVEIRGRKGRIYFGGHDYAEDTMLHRGDY